MLLSLWLLYIDPVSGSIALQAIVAGIVGGLAFFRRSIASVVHSVFRRSAPKDPTDQ